MTSNRIWFDTLDMRNRHLNTERTWRQYAIAMAVIWIVNIIGAVTGDALNAAFALGTSAWIVFAVRQAQASQDIVAACSLFMAVTEGEG